jgi:hypothetical protein
MAEAAGTSPKLAPIVDWAVRGHHRAFDFVTPHDDLEQEFSTSLGELFHSHVVDDYEVRLEIPGKDFIVAGKEGWKGMERG